MTLEQWLETGDGREFSDDEITGISYLKCLFTTKTFLKEFHSQKVLLYVGIKYSK